MTFFYAVQNSSARSLHLLSPVVAAAVFDAHALTKAHTCAHTHIRAFFSAPLTVDGPSSSEKIWLRALRLLYLSTVLLPALYVLLQPAPALHHAYVLAQLARLMCNVLAGRRRGGGRRARAQTGPCLAHTAPARAAAAAPTAAGAAASRRR